MFISIAWAFKDADHVQEMSTWQKRLGKTDFLKLSTSARERYLKLYPHSSHRFLMHKGDPDNVENKQVMAPEKKTGAARFKDAEDIFERRKRLSAVRKDISEFNKSNVAVINPTSLHALQEVKDSHLRDASDGINKNKTEIANAIQKQSQRLPHMYHKGLGAIKSLVSGEQKPDELSITTKHALHRVLGGMATVAVLGAGILACSAAAAPLGVLLGVTMFNMWAGSKHGKNLRDDVSDLRRLKEKKRNREQLKRINEQREADGLEPIKMSELGGYGHAEDDDYEGDDVKAGSKKKDRKSSSKEVAAFASSVFGPGDDDEELSDDHVINMVIDQVTDLLRHQSAADLKEHGDSIFATASDARFADLQYLLNFGYCDNYRPHGNGLMFNCPAGFRGLQRLFKNMGYESSVTEQEDNHAYHFDNGYGRVTIGQVDSDFFLCCDGDFYHQNGMQGGN